MGKCPPVNQQELYGKISIENVLPGWKVTKKWINLRNAISDNLSFTKIQFCHGADFSDSSLVNAT